MTRTLFVWLGFCMTLAGCGSVPPTPVEHFYRLQPVSVPAASKPLIASIVMRADSLYAERPLVYSDEANQRQLQQYHYHLWLYAPAQLVQDHLTTSLGQALVALGKRPGLSLEGRILRFDRVLSGKSSKALVALELVLSNGGKIVLSKTYQAEQRATDASVAAHVVATEQALTVIYAELIKDAANY